MHATRSPELLRIPEAAEKLNVSRASIYRWISEGRVPAVQLGGKGSPIRIPAAELHEWLNERRNSSDASESSGTPRSQTTTVRRVPGGVPAVDARQPAGIDEKET
jgi:excisionase family DNA binding protein